MTAKPDRPTNDHQTMKEQWDAMLALFREERDREIKEAGGEDMWRAAKAERNVLLNRLLEPDYGDPMRPPETSVEVKCLHCGLSYQSSEMVYEYRHTVDFPLWWCKTPTCDGAGFHHDIYEATSPMVAEREPTGD